MAHKVLEDGKEQMTLTILTGQMASGVSRGQHCTCLYICPNRQEVWVPPQKRRGPQPRNPPALAKLAANAGSCFGEARQHLAFGAWLILTGTMTSRLSMLYYAWEFSSILRPMNTAFMDISIPTVTDTAYFLIWLLWMLPLWTGCANICPSPAFTSFGYIPRSYF